MATAKKAEQEATQAPFTEKVTAAAHETVDRASARASAAEERVRETVDNTSENIANKKASLEADFVTATDKTRQFVIENPLMAAGVAFTAGLILSSLLSKRS